MAILSNANLKTLLDKLARFAAELNGDNLETTVAAGGTRLLTAFAAGLTVANSDVWSSLDTLIAGFADNDQKSDLLPASHFLNQNNPNALALLSAILAAPLAALDVHCALRSGVSTVQQPNALDAYLTSLNLTTPTGRVHGELLLVRKFSAGNVFFPTFLQLGTIAVTGAASGTYTHGAAVDLTKYGAGQIMLLNTNAHTTNAILSVTALKPGGATATVTFTAGGLTNNLLTAGSDITQSFSDVSGITVTSGGTAGDNYAVVLVPDRAVNAA